MFRFCKICLVGKTRPSPLTSSNNHLPQTPNCRLIPKCLRGHSTEVVHIMSIPPSVPSEAISICNLLHRRLPHCPYDGALSIAIRNVYSIWEAMASMDKRSLFEFVQGLCLVVISQYHRRRNDYHLATSSDMDFANDDRSEVRLNSYLLDRKHVCLHIPTPLSTPDLSRLSHPPH